jgi:hypothetical protein
VREDYLPGRTAFANWKDSPGFLICRGAQAYVPDSMLSRLFACPPARRFANDDPLMVYRLPGSSAVEQATVNVKSYHYWSLLGFADLRSVLEGSRLRKFRFCLNLPEKAHFSSRGYRFGVTGLGLQIFLCKKAKKPIQMAVFFRVTAVTQA